MQTTYTMSAAGSGSVQRYEDGVLVAQLYPWDDGYADLKATAQQEIRGAWAERGQAEFGEWLAK